MLALSVFDTNDSAASSGFDHFFDNGAVILATGILPTATLGCPAARESRGVRQQRVHRHCSRLPYPRHVLRTRSHPPPGKGSQGREPWATCSTMPSGPRPTTRGGSGACSWKAIRGISDGNPNPIRWTVMAGGRRGLPASGRDRDTFGVGYYFLGIGDAVKRSVGPGAGPPGRAGHGGLLQLPRHTVAPESLRTYRSSSRSRSVPTPRGWPRAAGEGRLLIGAEQGSN